MERAVIYCRCSTEEESQRDALKIQRVEAQEWVRKKGWMLVDEYVEAKSGTQMKGRTEYQRLFEDLQTNKFDIIVIKDQDRLMRNTKDWYLFIDRMQQNRKKLYMYLEQKWYSPDDALITGVRAIMAEEYSRNLSKKINNAHKGRQEKGTAVVLNSNAYGFVKKSKQTPEIQEEESRAIVRMYELSAEGYGADLISKQLYAEGYTDRTGQPYKNTRIRRIIRNPLYMGTAVMNKRHFDFETKKTLYNPPEDWIYHEHLVPAIVDKELWNRANQAMDARAANEGNFLTSGGKRNILTGRIHCGMCGATYYRTTRKRKTQKVVEWKCSHYLRFGRSGTEGKFKKIKVENLGCNNVALDNEILMQLLEDVRKQYYSPTGQDNIIDMMMSLLEKALSNHKRPEQQENFKLQLMKLENQKNILLDKLLNEIISDDDYLKKKDEIENQMQSLQYKLSQQEQERLGQKQQEQRLEDIRSWITNGGLEQATNLDMLEDIKSIIVYPDKLELELLINSVSDVLSHPIKIEMKYPYGWTTMRGRKLTEDKIITIWRKRPDTTVKEIAAELNIPYRAVLSRVNHLKLMGKVRFNGKGGNGIWEIKDT